MSYKNYGNTELYEALKELEPFRNSHNWVLKDQYSDIEVEITNRVSAARHKVWLLRHDLQSAENQLRAALNIEQIELHGVSNRLPEEEV